MIHLFSTKDLIVKGYIFAPYIMSESGYISTDFSEDFLKKEKQELRLKKLNNLLSEDKL